MKKINNQKKKIILFSAVLSCFVFSAYAYTGDCKGGTIIRAKNNETFCKSNVTMNWWSAAIWCTETGSRLATMYEMCPDWDGNAYYDKCPELAGKGSGNVWSSTAGDQDHAYGVNLSNGRVGHNDHYNGYYFNRHVAHGSAFCLQNIYLIKNPPLMDGFFLTFILF